MRDLNYQLKQLGHRNRDGSFATQADRERMLALFANQLHELGYRHMRADSLKPKHVEALLERWKAEGLSAATIKNRLAVLRWWAEKVGKENVVARENDAYAVERRQFVTNQDKGKDLDPAKVGEVSSPTSPCPCGCRKPSGCGGRSRSRSARLGPTRGTCCV